MIKLTEDCFAEGCKNLADKRRKQIAQETVTEICANIWRASSEGEFSYTTKPTPEYDYNRDFVESDFIKILGERGFKVEVTSMNHPDVKEFKFYAVTISWNT